LIELDEQTFSKHATTWPRGEWMRSIQRTLAGVSETGMAAVRDGIHRKASPAICCAQRAAPSGGAPATHTPAGSRARRVAKKEHRRRRTLAGRRPMVRAKRAVREVNGKNPAISAH
jgi:hypothetical protein